MGVVAETWPIFLVAMKQDFVWFRCYHTRNKKTRSVKQHADFAAHHPTDTVKYWYVHTIRCIFVCSWLPSCLTHMQGVGRSSFIVMITLNNRNRVLCVLCASSLLLFFHTCSPFSSSSTSFSPVHPLPLFFFVFFQFRTYYTSPHTNSHWSKL